MIEVRLPNLEELGGGRNSEAEIGHWLVDNGARVAVDEPLVEVSFDKVSVTLSAPAAGSFVRAAAEGELVVPGQVLGHIDPSG